MGPGQDNSTTLMSDKEPIWAIPKLAPDGSNWVMFKTCFLFAMAGHDIGGHFNRSETTPLAPTYSTPDKAKWTTMDRDKNQAYLLLVRKWRHDEHVACTQLAQVVSDSLLIKIQRAGAVANMWDIITTEFNRKGRMVQVDLHQRMME